jgi:hypothetical protein
VTQNDSIKDNNIIKSFSIISPVKVANILNSNIEDT